MKGWQNSWIKESLYIYCDLKVHAPESKILHFLNQCKISPNSIVVMNVWDNSLLQGRTAPTADEVGGPSGKPSAHLKDTQTRGRAHHQVEVAPYNKKFGEHLAAKMCWMTAHGHLYLHLFLPFRATLSLAVGSLITFLTTSTTTYSLGRSSS